MKLFAIIKDISPSVLLKKNFKTFSPFLMTALILTQSFNSFSFPEKSFFHSDFSFEKQKLFFKPQPNFDLIHLQKIRFGIDQKSLLSQVVITSTLNTSYCTGESGSILFETSGVFNALNKFSVQLSNYNGSFSNPIVIGFINSSTTGPNSVAFKIPLNMTIGNGYRMRIVASRPIVNSPDNGVNIQITSLPVPSVAVSSQIICPGGNANLNATCNSGTVKWYDAQEDGNLITSLTVSPTISTDYFAACEGGVSCSSVRARQIVIVNKPDVLIPPYASSCLNSDLELTVVTDETNLIYAWTGPSSFSSTLQNPTITNLTSTKVGVYSVRITNSNNCLVTGTTSVNVGTVLQNLSVVGNLTVCFSDTIKLTASASVPSGMTYTWTGPDSYTSTGQQFIRPASSFNTNGTINYNNGLYIIEANNASTGCSGATSLEIAVGNRPNIPLVLTSASVCENSTYGFNLAISGANFQNYSWSGPNGFTASSVAVCDSANNCNNSIVNITNFSAVNVGIYSMKATYIDENNLSCVVKAIKNISTKPGPDIAISSNSAVCLGDLLIFSTTYNPSITGVNSFSWTGPNNFTSTSQNPRINTTSLSETGNYKLTAVGMNSCVATATTQVNVVESLPPIVVPTAGVVLSSSITLTATGCNNGVLNWYQSADNQSVVMPVSPVVATSYYAKCNVSGCLSGKSGNINVSILPPVAISVKTGDWEDKNTWSIARVPLPIDSVIIRPTHFVTINSQAYAKWLAWSGFGNLKFASSNSKLNLYGNPITSPSVLTSNPTLVIEGNPVTFSATGSPIISWYKNGVSLNIDGSNYTVNQPIAGDIYTVKRSENGIASVFSNAIKVLAIPSSPVLSSNPTDVFENISVTFTSSGSGTISWYKNGIDLNITGSTYTVNQPVSGDTYTTKRSENGVISGQSNSISVASPTTPPVISSNPSTVIENISVTFFATGSGVISWYKNGVNLNVSGSNYTVNQPVKDDVYTAKRTEANSTSGASNAITVLVAPPPPSSNVVITVPNKPPYYFSDGHPPSHYDNNANLPAIFRNQPRYDPVNDLVWLKNDKIKIGINLKRGGQIAWASLINATTNLVYNGYDGGFQVTLDAYQKKDGYTQGGEVSGSGIPGQPTFSYNVTHGGDYLNNAASLIDYHAVPDGFYVKLRPIHYPLNAKFSETFIEVTYTIIRRSVKIDYRYTSFRTDGQWNGGGFDGAGAPACFIVNTLDKYKTFSGSSPWAFLPTQGGNLPITNNGFTPAEAHTTEHWGMVYDAQNPNSGIGVYNNTNNSNTTYFIFKQQEVYPGNGPGTEFNSGYTFFQPFIDFNITNRGNYSKDITAYLMIGSELEIRSEAYKFSGHENNIPRF